MYALKTGIDPSNGRERWVFPTDGGVYSSPNIGRSMNNTSVFVGSSDNSVYAINEGTGDEIWSTATGDSVDSSPTVKDGSVYIGSDDNHVYALDAYDGDEEWSFPVNASVKSSPTVAYGKVFVGSRINRLWALSDSGDLEWSKATDGYVDSSPAVRDCRVYVGSDDNDMYAFDVENGDPLWSFTTHDEVTSSPTAVDNPRSHDSKDTRVSQRTLGHHSDSTGINQCNNMSTTGNTTNISTDPCAFDTEDRYYDGENQVAEGKTVYIGSTNGCVYAVNASSGEIRWSHNTGSNIRYSSATVVNGIVYIGNAGFQEENSFFAINASTGKEIWSEYIGDVMSSPTIVKDVVYIGSRGLENGPNVFAFEDSSGEELWSFQAEMGISYSSPFVVNNTVYIGSDKVYALDADEDAQEREKWSYDLANVPKEDTNNYTESSPFVTNCTVYIGANTRNMLALDASRTEDDDGERLKWDFDGEADSDGGIETDSSPYIKDGTAYIGSSNDEKVYAIDTSTGELEWSEELGLIHPSSPTVLNDTLYIGIWQPIENNIYALDTSSELDNERERVVWSYKTEGPNDVEGDPTVLNDTLFISDDSGNHYALNVSPGLDEDTRVKWSFEGFPVHQSSPTVVMDPKSGSSRDSRVLNRTTGHHNESFASMNDGCSEEPGLPGFTVLSALVGLILTLFIVGRKSIN